MDERQKSHFLSLYCMILADGIIDAKEMETLYEIASRNYGLTPEDVCQAVKEAGTSYYVPQTLDEKVGLLYDMCLIAIADGTVDLYKAHRRLVYEIGALGVRHADVGGNKNIGAVLGHILHDAVGIGWLHHPLSDQRGARCLYRVLPCVKAVVHFKQSIVIEFFQVC